MPSTGSDCHCYGNEYLTRREKASMGVFECPLHFRYQALYRTCFPISCPIERMSTWPLKSSRTLPRPQNHSSRSASRNQTARGLDAPGLDLAVRERRVVALLPGQALDVDRDEALVGKLH